MDETISVIQLSDGFSPHGIYTELPRAFSDTTPTTFTREEGGNPEDPRFIFVDHPILFAILLRRSWAITAMMIFHLDG